MNVARLSVSLVANINRYTAPMRGAQRVAQNFQKTTAAVQNQLKAVTRVGMRAGLAFVALGYSISRAVAPAIEFESQMVRVGAIANATAGEMEQLSRAAMEMAGRTEHSARQVAQGMTFLSMAGFEVEQTIGAMPGVLQLATAGMMDLATAADITSNILTGYGMEVNDLARVNDVLVASMTGANVDLVGLGQAFKYAGPVAKAAGMQFEEAASMIALMGNAGIQASMAGTSLRGALTRLLNPSREATRIMNAHRISVMNADGSIKSFVEIIEQLEKSTISTGEMMELFGQRAGPAFAALLDQGSHALRDFTYRLEQSGGIAERIEQQQLNTLAGQMKILRSQIEAVSIAFGEDLIPYLRTGVHWFQEVTKRIQALDSEQRLQIIKWGAITAGVLGAIAVFGLFAKAASLVVGALGLVGSMLVLFLSPKVLLITALAAAGIALWTAWNEDWGGIASGVTKFATTALEKLEEFYSWFKDTKIFKAIEDWWEQVKSIWSEEEADFGDKIEQTLRVTGELVFEVTQIAWEWLIDDPFNTLTLALVGAGFLAAKAIGVGKLALIVGIGLLIWQVHDQVWDWAMDNPIGALGLALLAAGFLAAKIIGAGKLSLIIGIGILTFQVSDIAWNFLGKKPDESLWDFIRSGLPWPLGPSLSPQTGGGGGIGARFSEGAILPGFGGGDRVPALLEAGEAVVPARIVKGGLSSIVDWFRNMGVPRLQAGHNPGVPAGVQTAIDDQSSFLDAVQKTLQSLPQLIIAGISAAIVFIGKAMFKLAELFLGEEKAQKLADAFAWLEEETKKLLDAFTSATDEVWSFHPVPAGLGASLKDVEKALRKVSLHERLMQAGEMVVENLKGVAQGIGRAFLDQLPGASSAINDAVQAFQAAPDPFWGMVNAFIAGMSNVLMQTEGFAELIRIANVLWREYVASFSPLLDALVPLATIIANALIPRLQMFAQMLSILEPVVEISAKALEWFAKVTLDAAINVAETWNKLLELISKLPFVDLTEYLIDIDALREAQENLRREIDDGTEAMRSWNEQLRNVPRTFKFALARWQATIPNGGSLVPPPSSSPPGARPGLPGPSRPVINIYGDNYGIDDLERKIGEAIDRITRRKGMAEYGLTGGS